MLQFTYLDGNNLDALVFFDVSVSESHSYGADVTDFPVERGADLSDNVRSKPIMLRIEAFLTDRPLQNTGRQQVPTSASNPRPAAQPGRSKRILGQLEAMQAGGTRITVSTGLRQYTDMVLQAIEVPRDKSLKDGLRVTMSLKQVKVASSQIVPIKKAKENKGEGKVKGGDKTGDKTEEGTSEQSLLRKGKTKLVEKAMSVLGK